MKKKVEVIRKDNLTDVKATCESINKYESNIELINPNLMDSDGKRLKELLIPLETINKINVRVVN